MAVTVIEPVMFRDTDASGIGHYIGMLRYVERGEYALMEAIGHPASELYLGRLHFPRVHLEVDYRHPIRFGEYLRIEAGVIRIGTTSYTLGVAVYHRDDQSLRFQAAVTVVVVDAETMRPTPIPEALRAGLAQHLLD